MNKNKYKRTFLSALHKTAFCIVVATYAATSPTVIYAQQKEPTNNYLISEGKLSDAVAEFAAKSGVALSFEPSALQGETTTGLQGQYTIQEGFDALLGGTGFQVVSFESGYRLIKVETESEALVLAPIKVKGELLERTVQDSQTSASIVQGDALEARSDPNIFDVLERTPGVTLSAAAPIPSIRGINQRGPSGNGASLISLTVDGAAISDFGLLVENGPYSTWDLEQVEVLRGPQSTQSGRNALAGSINITSRDPIMGREFKIRGELGDFGTTGIAAAGNIANASETLALRISGDIREADGAIDNPVSGDDDVARVENTTYRAAIRWQPNENFDATFKYTDTEAVTGIQLFQFDEFPENRFNRSNVDSFQESDFSIFSFKARYQLNSNLDLHYDLTDMDADYFQPFDSDFSQADLGDGSRIRDFTSQQHEIRLLYTSTDIRGVIGLLYANYIDDGLTAGRFALAPGTFGTLTALQELETTNIALFSEFEYDLSKSYSIVAGFRYDREEQDDFLDRVITGLPFPPEEPTITDTTYNAFLPKLGVVYNFCDLMSLGFTIQRGYGAGGVRNVPALGAVDFEPEFTTNYELAWRSEAENGEWIFNVNAFYARWTDQQVEVGTSIADFRTVNAGESEYYGVELDSQWYPVANTELYVSASYVETKFLDFVDSNTDFSGNEFRDAPNLTLLIGGAYYFNNGVFFSTDVSYTDESFADAANQIETEDRRVLNARIGYSTDNWTLFAYIRNLTDEDYITGRQQTAVGEFVFAGEPRTFGVVFQYN
ncbi:MAG: TonB-dependent receptor [Pseudomonadota bacterium]